MNLKKGDKLVLVARGGQMILQKADSFLKKLGMEEESMGTMMLSEETLKKDWDNDYDERWNKY